MTRIVTRARGPWQELSRDVCSVERPRRQPQPAGRQLNGVSFVSATLGTKRLELLRALAPKTDVVAVLLDPHSTESQNQSRDVQEAAGALGVRVVVLNAGTASEIDTAFATLVQQRVGALLVSGSPTFGSLHKQLVALAARHALPTMYATREYSGAGGLISYGASILDSYRQAAIYVGRILKGDRPSDLPVLRPTKFELVINLNTAKALGLDIPDKLLALADEVSNSAVCCGAYVASWHF